MSDLYAPEGTKIYAMTDGIIIGHKEYYLGTYQVTVNHGNFIARYGEIKPGKEGLAKGLKIGSQVKKGQHIAYVGLLKFNSGEKSMLHIEIYNDSSNNLGIHLYNNLPYKRRSDLVDPTTYLDIAKRELPKGE